MKRKQRHIASVMNISLTFGQYLHRFAFLLLCTGAIGLLTAHKMTPQLFDAARVKTLDALSPIFSVASSPIHWIKDKAFASSNLLQTYRQNKILRLENEKLNDWQILVERLSQENKQLAELLQLKVSTPHDFITARVIARTPHSQSQSFVISAGLQDGVQTGQIVMGARGLIGRIIEVGTHSAHVLTLQDATAHIPVKIQGQTSKAILVGDHSDQPKLQLYASHLTAEIGDVITTSGAGGVFPADLPIGIVSQVRGSDIRVQTYTDFDNIDFVKIMRFESGQH